MNRASLVLAALTALGVACTGVTEPEWVRVPGLVLSGPPPLSSLIAPDTVVAGEPFQITVTTFGSSTCTQPDGYDLLLTSSRADIVPFDRTAVGAIVCTDDLHSFPRTLLLTFTTVGQAEIQVEGRGFDDRPARVGAFVTVLTAE